MTSTRQSQQENPVSDAVCFRVVCRDVDQVHDMMDDIAEQQDVAREISDAISNPVSFGQDMDEVGGAVGCPVCLSVYVYVCRYIAF